MIINNKGVSLIIVIFAMMLFSVLGWTLAVMQSTDFEANLRNLDSERALGLAEAGAQWGLRQLSQDSGWRTDPTNPDDDCNDSDDWITHTLNFGQYRVCCRNPQVSELCDAVIETEGYIPQYTDYRAMRQVKLTVILGSFDKVLQAHSLFNWSAVNAGTSSFAGDIQAAYYERDNDGTYNEAGVDYSNVAPRLPPDGTGDDRLVDAEPYPSINMAYYQTQAGSNVWDLARTATIEAILGGNRIRVSDNIFTLPASQWETVTVMRNLSAGTWDNQNWRVITSRINNTIVALESSVTWSEGDQIRVVRRYRSDVSNENLWYIKGDVLFDLRDRQAWELPSVQGDIRFRRTSVVAEGDIVIKGGNKITFDQRPYEYPNLGTQNGNVLSTDTPNGPSDAAKRGQRSFDGFIYTQNGNIYFNYIDAVALMGNNVTLSGSIRLRYDNDLKNLTGFIWGLSDIKWQEQ